MIVLIGATGTVGRHVAHEVTRIVNAIWKT